MTASATIFVGATVLVLATLCIQFLANYCVRHGMNRFPFVYVNEDGTARELTPDEIDYLNTRFEGSDGARPYVKGRYRDRTPDGKLCGFLPRNGVPRGIVILPSQTGAQ